MDTLTNNSQLRSGLLTGALLAGVWAVAAFAQPTSTYHLAPILVAGAVPALGSRRRAPKSHLLTAAVAGGLIAAAASVVLAALDLLRGPTLLPYGGAFAEALTFTVIGVIAGTVAGWLFSRE